MIEMIIVKADILAFYMLTDRRRLLLEPLRIGTYLAKLCLANQDHRMQSMSQHVVDLRPPPTSPVPSRFGRRGRDCMRPTQLSHLCL